MLLSRRWALHDIDDVERFCVRILESTRARTLPPHEFEDALAGLLAECWKLSETYDPKRTSSFSTYAWRRLRLRLVDIARARYRTRWKFRDGVYERPRPDVLSLDIDSADDGGLGAAVTGGGLDDGEHRLADELRALHARGRRPPGRNREVDDWAA